ncbi:hypothetical protein CDD83_2728 [Cordyceps sp. RAO-2017]|nr:hypothetical protein CDD83_2728 [Cordyceps sp. RAO-2017]
MLPSRRLQVSARHEQKRRAFATDGRTWLRRVCHACHRRAPPFSPSARTRSRQERRRKSSLEHGVGRASPAATSERGRWPGRVATWGGGPHVSSDPDEETERKLGGTVWEADGQRVPVLAACSAWLWPRLLSLGWFPVAPGEGKVERLPAPTKDSGPRYSRFDAATRTSRTQHVAASPLPCLGRVVRSVRLAADVFFGRGPIHLCSSPEPAASQGAEWRPREVSRGPVSRRMQRMVTSAERARRFPHAWRREPR